MTIRSTMTALGVALLLMQSGPVAAQQGKCLAGKTKCMSKKGTGLIKCEQLAETPGKPADPNANGCQTKVIGKYDGGVDPTKGCFEKLENKNPNDCISFDDTASTEADVDSCVSSFVQAIDPAPIDQTKCGAGKKKCVSKYFKARMKCYQLAQTPGKSTDPNTNACLDKAVAKYTGGVDPTKGCFYKLENKSGNDCIAPTGNSGTLQTLVDDCVNDLTNAVANPPTTTTSSSSTSSSSSSTAAPTTSSSSTVAPTTSSSSTAAPTTSSSSTAAPTTSSSSTAAPTTSSSSTAAPTTSSSSTAAPTTSSSSTVAPTTSSSSTAAPTTSSSSTVAPTTSSTSTTIGGGPTGFDFLSTTATGTCGNTFRDVGGVTALKNLLCGNLSLGGGLSQVPDNATPAGATNRFTLSGCVGPTCNIGATLSGSTPAGVDCTNTGCRFGVPLPIANAGLSVCVTNSFASPPTGTLNTTSGAGTWDFELNSLTILTGIPGQPCPICAVSVGGAACSGTAGAPCTGVCDGSPNQGAVCQSKNAQGLSSDCPAPAAVTGTQRCYRGPNNNNVCSTGGDCAGNTCAQFIGNIPVSLNPLTTGTSSLTSLNVASCTGAAAPFACCTGVGTGTCTGDFCPAQAVSAKGAFNSAICFSGPNSGKSCVNNTAMAANDAASCGAATPVCRPGNLTNYCSGGANDGLGCSSAATCPAPGACVRAGTLVQLIREVGTPAGALSIGVPKAIKLGSSFCVAATTSPTVNANANLPGPGATSVVGTVTLLP